MSRMTNPVVAYVTRLGYLYCPDCMDIRGERHDVVATYDSRNAAVMDNTTCDGCGEPILYDPTLLVPVENAGERIER